MGLKKRRWFFSRWVKSYVKKALQRGISLHRWLRWWNMEGGSFTEEFERQVTIWRAPPLGAPLLRTLRDRLLFGELPR
jgi:hypothetical protein